MSNKEYSSKEIAIKKWKPTKKYRDNYNSIFSKEGQDEEPKLSPLNHVLREAIRVLKIHRAKIPFFIPKKRLDTCIILLGYVLENYGEKEKSK